MWLNALQDHSHFKSLRPLIAHNDVFAPVANKTRSYDRFKSLGESSKMVHPVQFSRKLCYHVCVYIILLGMTQT